jgi:PadR family transcriptional regulator
VAEPLLLAGTLDLLVLRALMWGPRHGYAVAHWIHTTSRETIEVEDRALYLCLHRLEDRGFIESEWALSENNRRARFYDLTAAGRRQLKARERDFGRYVEAVFLILGAES